MTASTENVFGELGQFLNCTSPKDLHRPAAALAHIREMVARACSGIPDDSHSLLRFSIGLERIELEAKSRRAVDTYFIAGLTGLELGATVSAALLHRPEWETFLGVTATLTMMALTQPGLDWNDNRRIRGSIENLLAIAHFSDIVTSAKPESGPGSTSFEPSGDVVVSGL